MLYIVVGMHKSGTTLLARSLHAAGIPMIDYEEATQDYDEGNKYERSSIANLNKAILDAAHINTLYFEPPTSPIRVSEADCERMREIVSELNAQHASWGMKDPRFCLVYEEWLPMLPDHTIVAVYRHPAAVAKHYLSRAPEKDKETPEQQADILYLARRRWIEHNTRLLRLLRRSRQPRILVSYERLMEHAAEWDRLSRTLGIMLPDVRDSQKYRNRRDRDKRHLRASLRTLRRTRRSAEWLYLRLELLRLQSRLMWKHAGSFRPLPSRVG